MTKNLIDLFMERTAVYPVPDIFRKWGGLHLVSSLCSRRVWTRVLADKKLFPNIFVILHGDPAIGKSFILGPMRQMLEWFPTSVGLAPNGRCTPQKMVELMAKMQFNEGTEEGEWSYAAMFSEIGSFIKTADIAQLQELAELWDCPPRYEAATINRGEDYLVNPYMTFLACAQPAWMSQVLSNDQMDLGLPSRIMFVTCDKPRDVELFKDISEDHFADITKRLPEINKLKGYMAWEKQAQLYYTNWRANGSPGADGMPFQAEGPVKHYAARRHLHVAKLAMLYAIARHPDRLILMQSDIELAMSTVFEAEVNIHAIFDGVGGNPYRLRENQILRSLAGRQFTTSELHDVLAKNFPTIHVGIVLDSLEKRGALVNVSGDGTQQRWKVRQ